jgi:hypothetical protein
LAAAVQVFDPEGTGAMDMGVLMSVLAKMPGVGDISPDVRVSPRSGPNLALYARIRYLDAPALGSHACMYPERSPELLKTPPSNTPASHGLQDEKFLMKFLDKDQDGAIGLEDFAAIGAYTDPTRGSHDVPQDIMKIAGGAAVRDL